MYWVWLQWVCPVGYTIVIIIIHVIEYFSFSVFSQITLYPIREWKLLKHPISHLLSRCNEEHTPPLQLKLSDNIIESVANLHRVIKHPRWAGHDCLYVCERERERDFSQTDKSQRRKCEVFQNVFMFCFRGNCILVGSHGQPAEEIATLALYIGGYSIHRMATDSDNSFHDQLRSLFRLAALERKQVALVIHVNSINWVCVSVCVWL